MTPYGDVIWRQAPSLCSRVNYLKSRVPQGRVSSVVVLHSESCAACGVLQVPIDLPSPLFALITFSQTRGSQELQVKGSFSGQEAGLFHPNIKFISLQRPLARERFQTRCSSLREVSPIRLLLESVLSFANALGCHFSRLLDWVSHYPMLTTCYPSRRTQGTRAVR
jgi:hypothetical protein